jgi:hypothetical protein
MNRSSWASGRAKVPSYSIGFWVAMTRNGSGIWIGGAVDRCLALLHALEQGGLGLRGGPVDLVGQDHLGS